MKRDFGVWIAVAPGTSIQDVVKVGLIALKRAADQQGFTVGKPRVRFDRGISPMTRAALGVRDGYRFVLVDA